MVEFHSIQWSWAHSHCAYMYPCLSIQSHKMSINASSNHYTCRWMIRRWDKFWLGIDFPENFLFPPFGYNFVKPSSNKSCKIELFCRYVFDNNCNNVKLFLPKSSGWEAMPSSLPLCPQTAILNVFLMAEPSSIQFLVVPK